MLRARGLARALTLRSLGVASLAVASLGVASTATADFNPFGRGHGGKHPTPHTGAGSPKPRTPGATHPTPSPTASTTPDATDKADKADKSTDALIVRYTALALGRPGEPFPLERLVELYRKRDGNLDQLVSELSARADKAGPEHYAALVVLAAAYRGNAEPDRAVATYQRAIADSPKNPVAVLALGRLLADQGDKVAARRYFDEALVNVTADTDREQLLHALLGLALDLRDFDGAKHYADEIVRRAKGSFFARAELGRELYVRGEFGRAEVEYREIVKAAAGDNRALGPALKDLGQTLAKESKNAEALTVLKRALEASAGQSGLRREILDAMVEVHRATGGIAELVLLLEKEHPDDFERLTLLAGLYEETGRVEDALATYKRALGKRDDIATRQKVIQLLEVQGKLDEAVKEYQALVHAAPHDPEIVFRLADALIQRGDRREALVEIERLEARSAGDDEILAAVADFYERIDEPDRAAGVLDRLSKSGGRDPRYLVELGDHYYRQGDTKKALEIWERIRVVVPDKAKALLALGEVLLEHDIADKAIEALRQATELAPKDARYEKALALALERTGTNGSAEERLTEHAEARQLWEKLLRDAGDDRTAAREARQHIVTLWGLDGHLAEYAKPLERKLAANPPDLDAGRLLGEVYTRLRRPADAERVLRVVVLKAPGDVEASLGLERALVAQQKLAQAIAVLEGLVKIDTQRAREHYQRMAQYAAELYRDDDAIRYASKAVELSPDDADGHRKLGEMYRRRQDVDHAVVEFRLAIAKNDRLFPVYFDLAELLLSRGTVDEADGLLRRVVRSAQDDELVARAARLSIQVNLGRGTLESLERELLPLALGNPARPLYRRLLVEVYGNLAFPLAHDAKSSDPERARAAREALRRIGERAVKPLLDALGDDRDSQQRTAIELLSHISNRGAGPALVAFATGKADGDLRTRAMVAAGALADPQLLPELKDVIAPAGDVRVDETDTVAVAAAFAVARMQSPKARPLLAEMLKSDAPSVRALGALGLGLIASHADAKALLDMAVSPEQGFVARAGAAFALGALGGDRAAETLARLADSSDPLLCATAVIGIARVRAPSAAHAVATALVSADPALREAAADAAVVLSTHEYRMPDDALAVPDDRVDARKVLVALRPHGYTPDEEAAAIVAVAPDLADAAATAVHASPEAARVVADALLSRSGRAAFAPLGEHLDRASDASRKAAEDALDKVKEALTGPFLTLAKHPSADVRARAVRVLALETSPDATRAVVEALGDSDDLVERTALVSLSNTDDPRAIEAVTELARRSPAWPVRARAAEALGGIGKGAAEKTVAPVLAAIVRGDPIAFVREAAIRALGSFDPGAVREALSRAETSDPEPRLRELAKEMLQGSPH